MIAGLRESDPALFQLWEDTSRHIEGEAHLMRSSGRFPLSAVDKFNLYAVFLELGSQVYGDTGDVGLIVKAGYISDSLCAALFANTLREKQLVAVAEFENRRKLFPAVDSRERFALVTLGHNAAVADFCFDNLTVGDLALRDRHIRMSYDDIVRLSPNTKNCPKFSDARQFRVTRRCYDRFRPLHTLKPDDNPWGVSIDRYINVSDFSDSILLAAEFDDGGPLGFAVSRPLVPLYEGKLFYQFDHRYASYSVSGNDVSCTEVSDKTPERRVAFYRFIPTEIATRRNPRLGTGGSVLVARDITNRTNERGVIAAVIPENITDYTVRVIQLDETTGRRQLALLSILNSCVFDYLARQRIGGTHLSNYVLEQVPAPAPNDLPSSVWDFVVPRAIELTYTGRDLEAFAADCGCSGPPFRWDDERRFLLRCELDAAFFHLYLGTPEEWQQGGPELLKEFPTPRDAVDYVMETFPIVKRKDVDAHGTYRTKDQILAIYDMMAEAIRTGRPYQTLLDPPPADPRVAHPPREVVTLTQRQVEIARAMAYVVLLLRAWNRPVARAALEPALVLMLSDHARQQILGQAGRTAAKRAGAPSQGYVEGLDHLIGALESGGMVTIAERGGQQVLELGPRAGDIPDPPQPDRQRVEQTMRAFETLGEDRARIQLSEVLDERFVLVQS